MDESTERVAPSDSAELPAQSRRRPAPRPGLAGITERLATTLGSVRLRIVEEQTKTNRETVRRYLTGQSPPSLEFLSAVARTYDVTLEWLIDGRVPQRRSDFLSRYVDTASIEDLFTEIGRRLGSNAHIPCEVVIRNTKPDSPLVGPVTKMPKPTEVDK